MIKNEQKRIIENAAEELFYLIKTLNDKMKAEITCADLGEPDYYDYQTCYELMVIARNL